MELCGFRAQDWAEFGKLGRGVEFSVVLAPGGISRIISSVCVLLSGLFKTSARGIALLISWPQPGNLGSVATFTPCCCPFAQEQILA